MKHELPPLLNLTNHHLAAKIKENAVCVETLKLYISYNPDNGDIFWKDGTDHRYSGMRAGGIEKNGYLVINFKRKKHKGHRVAWLLATGCWPNNQIDHINGIRSDNRLCNLRDVTQSANQQNQRSKVNKLLGAYFHKPTGRWMASVKFQNKDIYVGLFDTEESAHEAYAKKRRELQEVRRS